jgi:hypothetical protein
MAENIENFLFQDIYQDLSDKLSKYESNVYRSQKITFY